MRVSLILCVLVLSMTFANGQNLIQVYPDVKLDADTFFHNPLYNLTECEDDKWYKYIPEYEKDSVQLFKSAVTKCFIGMAKPVNCRTLDIFCSIFNLFEGGELTT